MEWQELECITVTGRPSAPENHAWNMVKLNGQWVLRDHLGHTALDGRKWEFVYTYFNVTSDFLADTDHQWDYDSVPEATAEDGGEIAQKRTPGITQNAAAHICGPAKGGGYSFISRYITAFWAWRRFSASSKISSAWASKTSAVISSPRWAGRQCCTMQPGLVRAISSPLT